MAFTRPWDDTFPPDTQQANLLGQDIRRDKEDTAERIRAFGAGKIANRETPETDFGNANIGALFFAEDEGKLYRWNGTAWLLVSINRQFADSSTITIVDPAVDTDGNSITIPAAFLVAGAVIDIFARWRRTVGASVRVQQLLFGSTVIADSITFSVNDFAVRAKLLVVGAASQRGIGLVDAGTPGSGSAGQHQSHPDPTEAIVSAITVKSQVVSSVDPTTTWVHDLLVVKILFG